MILQKQTVSDTLWKSLTILMQQKELKDFRLVGGTSLSLQLGHRMSVDIDLFTDLTYDSIDFNTIDKLLKSTFSTIQEGFGGNNSMGKTYFVGASDDDLVKIDLFYTDPFVYPLITTEGIRIAGKEEIAAMKLEVIGNGGRKKDFWDLHELLDHFSIAEMIDSLVKISKEQISYNLTSVANNHNFFANGILVHNKANSSSHEND